MSTAITAPIFDIQRFSIHDGPGIRTLIFLKGCPLRCAWCQNPESQAAQPAIAFYQERCRESFCCQSACSHQAINTKGFRINYNKCTVCGDCVDACAYDALKQIGEPLTPERLMEEIRVDKSYFANGGGVTLTGGEPTLYPKFVDRFLTLCQQENIHSNLETAGLFDWAKWQPILEKLNLIYFDLKIFDPERFKQIIGENLDQILSNARALVTQHFPVEFRMALVPGYTDSEDNINAAIQFLQSLNQERIHLLDYHNMGEVKIDIIQGDQPRLGLKRCGAEQLEAVQNRFEEAGIKVLVSM